MSESLCIYKMSRVLLLLILMLHLKNAKPHNSTLSSQNATNDVTIELIQPDEINSTLSSQNTTNDVAIELIEPDEINGASTLKNKTKVTADELNTTELEFATSNSKGNLETVTVQPKIGSQIQKIVVEKKAKGFLNNLKTIWYTYKDEMEKVVDPILNDVERKVANSSVSFVHGLEKTYNEAKKSSRVIEMIESLAAGNIEKCLEILTTTFKSLTTEEQQQLMVVFKNLAEEIKNKHEWTKFIGRLIVFYEEREDVEVKASLANWITRDMLSVIDDIIIDAGYPEKQRNDLTIWLKRNAPIFLLETNVSFQLLSSDYQELVILKLKQIAENRSNDVALAQLLERLANFFAGDLENFGKLFANDIENLKNNIQEIFQKDQSGSIIRDLMKRTISKILLKSI